MSSAESIHADTSPGTPQIAITVFIAEDHDITLWGLLRLIDAANPPMKVVGTASSRDELVNHAAVATADVLLLDLDLRGQDTSVVLADLCQRCKGRVLVLTGTDDLDQHRAAVVKGARGVVHKTEPAQSILKAIEKVHAGEVWLSRRLLDDVLGLLTDVRNAEPVSLRVDPAAQRMASLTVREREVAVTMVRCAGAKQLAVAAELGMSEHTLRNHLTAIYGKLLVRGRLEMHVFMTTHGLAQTGRIPVAA